MVQKTRVIKKSSSEGGERRCSPYGWRQTVSVSRLWSGDREWSVAQGWSPNRRDNQSCCGWQAQVTAALDVSYPADTVSEEGRSCADKTQISSTVSPENPFILGSKGRRSRLRVKNSACVRFSLLLVVAPSSYLSNDSFYHDCIDCSVHAMCCRCRILEAVPTQLEVLDRRLSTTSGLPTGSVLFYPRHQIGGRALSEAAVRPSGCLSICLSHAPSSETLRFIAMVTIKHY